MAKINFTAGRVADFQCEAGKSQSFLWDSNASGLGLRATANGSKSFIFQAKLDGQAIRITIGSPKAWSIEAAQAEARRLQVMIDLGNDPRQVKADAIAEKKAEIEAKEAERIAAESQQLRESVTLRDVWDEYVKERSPLWSQHHINAHRKIIQAGGEKRARSQSLTSAGPLSVLADLRLVELTSERVEEWARVESIARPSSGRLAIRMLKACLNWCSDHKIYKTIVSTNAAKSSKVRESLGKPKVKYDLLQREQLNAWFDAVRKIKNPVISSYLQCLLITGARREEMAALKWADVDFQWHSLKLKDKIEDFRMVPLTPYVAHLLSMLPRRNEWVFSSPTAANGRIAEPRYAHNEANATAGLPHLTLHGLRRSFATLSEWTETPAGIAAQIQGHAPQGVREQNYIRRPLDLLRMWHIKIESWMLEQAGVEFAPINQHLRMVK
ncbi:tyrosine-type recombinase/integrase [Undibacterium sp. Ji67W]|uniref:tyrosine-type recombinase/integrase n=1 Tax=Undibacterium sp. Ji67W TaxID=3413042 RepID=UPI003BEFA3A6